MKAVDERDYASAGELLETIRSNDTGELQASESILCSILMGECHSFMGRAKEALAICERIAEELSTGAEHELYARACFVSAVAKSTLGNNECAIQDCNKSVYAYLRVPNSAGAARSLNWLGVVYLETSDYPNAVRSYRHCDELARSIGAMRLVAIARFNLSKPLTLMGELEEAAQLLDSNTELLLEHGDDLNCRRQILFSAFVRLQRREFEVTRQVLMGTDPARRTLPQREQGAWCEYMGELELCCGNHREAEMHLLRAIEIGSGESRDESVIGQSRRLLAEVRLAQGDLDETLAECDRALVSIRKVGERFEEGVVFRVIGEVHSRRGNNADARAAFKQSLDILRDIGAKLELAKTCLGAGESVVFSRRERLANLAEGERLFEEVGVQYWIDRTRDELKRVLNDRGDEIAEQTRLQPTAKGPYFITADNETKQTLDLAERYARKDIAILITGETGVGKDQLARHIHSVSHRHNKPLVAIDLNNIPESLWESELFGHRKGTFTGATAEKTGLLESANGGTVFLNEIGNLPLGLQAKLLEFLDTHQVRRLGDLKPIDLDVRLIAATNLNLKEAVAKNTFRADLYYRLAQAPLHLRPLRERRSDILPLIRHFLVEYGVPPGELNLLDRQLWVDRAINGQWSGNARDLRSFAYRLVALADRPADPEFPRWAALLVEQSDIIREPGPTTLPSKEKLIAALENGGWNQRAAARDLGISEATVRRLISRFEIARGMTQEQTDLARD